MPKGFTWNADRHTAWFLHYALVCLTTEHRPPSAMMVILEDLRKDLDQFLGCDGRGGPPVSYDASDSPT